MKDALFIVAGNAAVAAAGGVFVLAISLLVSWSEHFLPTRS